MEAVSTMLNSDPVRPTKHLEPFLAECTTTAEDEACLKKLAALVCFATGT